MRTHRVWRDSRIQVNWQENETVKYLNRNHWDRIWRPKIINLNAVSAAEQGGFQLLDLIITELKSHMTC